MSRKKWSVAPAVLMLALFSHAAVAQNDFYLLAALGATNSDVALGGINRVDDDDVGYALGAGYAFYPGISIELAYQDFGSQNGATDCPPGYACLVIPVTTQADVTAVSLSILGSVPFNDRLDAYGRLGIASWDVGFDGISSAFDASGKDILFGAGLRWSLDDRWKVFAEYTRLNLDLDTASLGLSYHF
jgi:OmpA-OmpF porin, OOP family